MAAEIEWHPCEICKNDCSTGRAHYDCLALELINQLRQLTKQMRKLTQEMETS